MISRFDAAAEFVLRHEGGLVDDPADPGGLTNHGISLRFARAIGLDEIDVRRMTRSRAREIFREHFWAPIKADALPPGLDLLAFDMAVNQGLYRAAIALQQALQTVAPNLVRDGIIGPRSLAAAARADLGVIDELAALRAVHYARHPQIDRFGLGWFRRLMAAHGTARDDYLMQRNERASA